MTQLIALATVLFVLSLIFERINEFFKTYLSCKKICWVNWYFVGDTTTKFPNGSKNEQRRQYRILKMNLFIGFVTALIAHASLFSLLKNTENPGLVLGWGPDFFKHVKYSFINRQFSQQFQFIIGCFFTGAFISLGSKFWHDLLDILYEVKNAKRVLSDPATYKIDNVEILQKVFSTYQSEFIKAAYLEAKAKYMAMESVKAIAIKSNDLGYYFELTLNKNDPSIGQLYQYLLDDGTPQNIPIKIDILSSNDKIKAQSINLSSKIFDVNQTGNFGTLGVLVKPLDDKSTSRYILTCCHNVVEPLSNLPYNKTANTTIRTASYEERDFISIGEVYKAERDHQIDGALIEIDLQKIKFKNYIPGRGIPQKAKELVNSDRNNLQAFLYGAKSGSANGIVTSIYNEIKVTYNSNEEFIIVDVIAISNNNKSITDGGDSGACVVDENRNVIGLVLAGSEKNTYVLPINILLNKLQVQLA